jgi:pyruvate dehydrogenase E2 component (dihydrolipoamide acetyltransferase)
MGDDKVTIIRWLKREGEVVREGDPIGELGTDKATVTLEAWDNGVLRLFARPGDVVRATDEFVKIERPGDSRP